MCAAQHWKSGGYSFKTQHSTYYSKCSALLEHCRKIPVISICSFVLLCDKQHCCSRDAAIFKSIILGSSCWSSLGWNEKRNENHTTHRANSIRISVHYYNFCERRFVYTTGKPRGAKTALIHVYIQCRHTALS